jgi:hypothetical protein
MSKKIERVQSNRDVFVPNAANAEIAKAFTAHGKLAKSTEQSEKHIGDLLSAAGCKLDYLLAPKKEQVKELVSVGGQEWTREALFALYFDSLVIGRVGAASAKLLKKKPSECDDKKPRFEVQINGGKTKMLTEKGYRGKINADGHRDMGNLRRKLKDRLSATAAKEKGTGNGATRDDDAIVADYLNKVFRKLTSEKTNMTGDVVTGVADLRRLASTLGLSIESDQE